MKLYDFNPDPQMSPVVGLLYGMVTHNYERVRRLVEGLTQDEIDFRGPQDDLNSIAQLMRHLAVVDLHWVFRLQTKAIPPDLQAIFGPMNDENGRLPMVKNVSLQTLLDQYDQVHDKLKEVCLKLTDADVNQVVPFEKGNQSTIRWGIWHIADHCRHHYANIIRLKKMMRDYTKDS